jgi:hypothetical protein
MLDDDDFENSVPPLPPDELRAIHNAMIAKPLDTEDYRTVSAAIQRQYEGVLNVADPSRPWAPTNRAKVRPLVIIGAFRSGKTYLVDKAMKALPAIPVPGGVPLANVFSATTPANFNLETFGRALLDPMRLTPARKIGADATIERLHRRIIEMKPIGYRIDEAQRMLYPDRVSEKRLGEERLKIFGQLRMLVDLEGWPLPLILTGTEPLIHVMEQPEMGELRNLSDHILLAPMSMQNSDDLDDLADALASFAHKAGMLVSVSHDDELYARLMRGANFARGLAFDICKEAILITASERSPFVTLEHFATHFARKVGSTSEGNMFAATDWYRIDPKLLMRAMSGENPPVIGQVTSK